MGTEAVQRLRAHVSGDVQGVGFRMWARSLARTLQLTGWAANLPDGRVQVEAQGRPADLRRFAEELHKGPRLARVDAVAEEWVPALREEKNFRVS